MHDGAVTENTQYLTFTLAEELFALDIGKVREVLDYTTVTRVPGTPEFMRGVINLRGSVVPVVDIRLKFGMPASEAGVNSCIIIVEVAVDGDNTVLGALSDAVQEVLELEPGRIEPPPRIGTRLNIEFLRGMGKRDEDLIMILDFDKVFSIGELTVARDMAGEPGG
jgi:purine-binding chemotaxis protein CheW